MAPPKTTGKGKPAITIAEKAAEKGLSIADYKKRSAIGIELRQHANYSIGKKTKGVKLTPEAKSELFSKAWSEARAKIRAAYPVSELERLKVQYKDPPPGSKVKKIKKPKKATKSKTGKKGAAK